MKCLVILTLAIAVHAQIFPQDTPEVAAAKAAHFAEHAKATALVGAPLQNEFRSAAFTPFTAPFASPFATPFATPFAAPVVTPQGFLQDTPDVAAARAAHLVEHARAAAAGPRGFLNSDPYAEYYRAYYNRYYPSQSRYFGPQAVPTVLPSGYLADTPEVAHAKAAHLYRLYQEATRF